jgi:hypothetical protein
VRCSDWTKNPIEAAKRGTRRAKTRTSQRSEIHLTMIQKQLRQKSPGFSEGC